MTEKELSEQLPDGWMGQTVQCDLCAYSWVAVYHTDCEKLECPNCGNMVHFETKTTNQ